MALAEGSLVQSVDYLAIAPPGLLALAAVAVLAADAFLPAARRGVTGLVALGGVVLTAAVTALVAAGVFGSGPPRRTFCQPDGGACSYVLDEFALLMQLVMLVAAAVVLLIALAEVRDTRLPAGEFHFLVLAAASGALALAAARDLITLVVCLEVVSLPVFALAALRRYDGRSTEAGLKMFLVSVVSTAVMLFGIGLVYGVTGSMHLERIAPALRRLADGQAAFDQPAVGSAAGASQVAAVGIVLVLVGFGFKISAVPFHFWAPDTYQGSPIAVAAFLSVVSKMAGFAGMVLVLLVGFAPYAYVWGPLLAVLAAVTMTIGNLVALRQRAAVRLLAWSSIAQAGYILAPLGAAAGLGDRAPRELAAATVGYLAIYAIMNIGAFAVVGFVGWASGVGAAEIGAGGRGAAIEDYRGLVRRHPAVAVAMAFFLACLAGLPPGLAGLFAKIVVFRATVSAGYGWLAVIMAVNTVIGLYYYLAWAARLFTPAGSPAGVMAGPVRWPVPLAVRLAIGVAVLGTLLLSVVPQIVLDIAPG
jgi:NADH-quinone oxidoreductase subunit N